LQGSNCGAAGDYVFQGIAAVPDRHGSLCHGALLGARALRAHLAELGLVAAQGDAGVNELRAIVKDEQDTRLPIGVSHRYRQRLTEQSGEKQWI
jgi:hypothetical protein